MALYDISARLVLEGVDSSSVQRAISGINSSLEKGTKSSKSFYDAVTLKGVNLAGYAALGGAMAKIGMVVASATHDAIRFDQELAKLAQTVGVSNRDIREHSDAIRTMSVAYGLSAPKIAETVRVLAQAGYSLNEAKAAADELAKTTLLASFESISNTTEGLIAINKQFTETVGQSARVLSLLNVVAKKYAVESDDLVDAAKRAGGVFAATGGSLEELVTIYTTVRDTTRESSETISTGLRTIFSRLQRPKTIDYLRQFGIELTDLKGNFIGNYQAIIEIQKGIERANIQPGSLQFSEIVEQLGGVLQQSRVIPLLTQAAKMQRIYADAQNASSETAADLAKAQDTLSFKLAQTQQNFAKLIGDVMETGTFKAMISTVLSLTNAFIGFAGSIKELIPLLATFAAIKLSKSLLGVGLPSFGRGKAPIKRASGGFVPGSGSGDTVPAMLEPGEFVIRKSAAQAMGAEALHGINKYADGGYVDVQKFENGSDRLGVKKGKKKKKPTKIVESKQSYGMLVAKQGNPKDMKGYFSDSKSRTRYIADIKVSGFKKSKTFNDQVKSIQDRANNAGKELAETIGKDKLIDQSSVISKLGTATGQLFENYVLTAADKKSPKNNIFDIERSNSKLKELTSQSVVGLTDIKKTYNQPNADDVARKAVNYWKKDITKFASGGSVGTDTVPALLTPGEFVVNKESAQAFGYGNLNKVNKYASGGYVGVQKFYRGSRGNGVKKPDVFVPPNITENSDPIDPPQIKPRGSKKASGAASDAARTGAFSASDGLDGLEGETKRVQTSFSDLAFVAAGVASQYTDSESAMGRAIGTTLEFVSSAALAVSALELFGISLNAKSISSAMSGGFKGIASKASKMLATSVGGPSVASASTVSTMSALAGGVVATTAAMAAAAASVYAFGSIVDSARGLTEATNKAIAEGNSAKAAEAATYEKSQSDATMLSTAFTALIAGVGVAAALIFGFATWPVLLGAAIAGVVAKLALMTDIGSSFMTTLRDLGASFGLLESSASIAAKASMAAALQRADTVTGRNKEALAKQVGKIKNAQDADKVLGGDLIREDAQALGAADQETKKAKAESRKQEQANSDATQTYIGTFLDNLAIITPFTNTYEEANQGLAAEQEANRLAMKEKGKAAYDQIAPAITTKMEAFADAGGTDWTTFLNSLSPAARQIIELAGNGTDLANQLADAAAEAKTEVAIRAILNAQMLKLTTTTAGLAEANRKGIAASQLGGTIAGMSSSGFRTSSLSNAASSEDVNKQISAARSLGVTGYDENVSKTIKGKSEIADLEKKYSMANPEERKTLAEGIQKKKKDVIEAAGGSTEGLSDTAINEAFDSVTSSADVLQEKLVSAATNVEAGINKFLDSLSAAVKAQREYVSASNDATLSSMGRDKDLQSFRVGGSTVKEIRARQDETKGLNRTFATEAFGASRTEGYNESTTNLKRIGQQIVAQQTLDPLKIAVGAEAARKNKAARDATNADRNSNNAGFLGGGFAGGPERRRQSLVAPGGASPGGVGPGGVGPAEVALGETADANAASQAVVQSTTELEFQFSALQIAAEGQAEAIREETKMRESHIEAIKEELSLEKDRAQTIEEFNIALSGGAGRDAQRDAQKKLRSLQKVENARLTGGEAAANKEIGRAIDRNGGDRSFYTGIQAPETAQNLEGNASATGGRIGLRRLGPNSELGQNLNNVGQTGFTAQGAVLAGQVGAQNTEIKANDAALVEGMRLHSEMLSSSAAMFNQSIASMTGGLGKFSTDMAVILDGLKGASIALQVQGGNLSVDISDKSGVVGMIGEAAKKQITDMITEAIRGKEMGGP
jgi:TP901 family phage tail tape measure protein